MHRAVVAIASYSLRSPTHLNWGFTSLTGDNITASNNYNCKWVKTLKIVRAKARDVQWVVICDGDGEWLADQFHFRHPVRAELRRVACATSTLPLAWAATLARFSRPMIRQPVLNRRCCHW